MGLSDYLRIIRRRWLIIVALTLLCSAGAAAYASTIPPTYTASTRLYVSMATGTSVNDSYQGGLAAQQRITSYADMVGGVNVAGRVISDLGLQMTPAELQSKITASFPPATTLLDISVTDTSAERARLVADCAAAQFRRLIGEVETTVVGAAPAAQATVIDPAQVPTHPAGPNSRRLLLIGLLGGLALGCLAAIARDRLDRRVRTARQLAEVLPVPVLASVPGRESDATKVVARLRARLTCTRARPNPSTLMLTSFSGRSTPGIAVRLSKSLADAGRRVALVDVDVSGAGVSAYLGKPADPGVADWLRTPHPSLDELLQFSPGGVGLMPLGAADDRTADLLGSERFAELISHLEVRFDYVLVDTAPTLTDAAALTVAARCDATLAVVELGTSSLTQVQAAAAGFSESGAELLGAVAVTAPSRRERREQRRRQAVQATSSSTAPPAEAPPRSETSEDTLVPSPSATP